MEGFLWVILLMGMALLGLLHKLVYVAQIVGWVAHTIVTALTSVILPTIRFLPKTLLYKGSY